MQIHHELIPITALCGSAVALGYFDGVHCGHRAVLGAAAACAAQNGLTAAAFTFELPGNSTLKGGRILSLQLKHTRIAEIGIEEYLEPPFEQFRSLSPEEFVQRVLVECFHAKAVFCGDNFTFGAKAAGDVPMLRKLCAPLGIQVNIVPMAQYQGQTVSSTRIRAALESGDLGVMVYGDEGGEGTLKKYIQRGNSIVLQPFNPAYDELVIKGEDLNRLYIAGKVVETKAKW